ncbi:hypothetical protein [Polymorphum gilvum]|uniref:Hypothetical bacteriophage protein n=1 Tax=Polymorphum gilvum (strain LMG 25793 / CGMCC 1.9160 / SL003B-26A1) TaxID=991905 RepID=F2J645_POLGS|nr:hypothetical protein [Polymorphum gilvum]ADZ72409.1 Hypothetical bacteriophage protein [Polymorphum gilvum SL003B-26A1]
MPLAKERQTPMRIPDYESHPLAAGVKIHAGALVVLDAGLAKPGYTATGLVSLGRAERTVDNTAGAAGDARVEVLRKRTFLFANLEADPVALADVGKTCFVVDDETVAKTDGTGTRSPAGRVAAVDPSGVWVDF